jgi:GNAT superfamily N-acetyltransferase
MKEDDDRSPPTRIRITGLQEAQVSELLEVDALCAAAYHDLGFDAAEVPVRSASDLVALTRGHNVIVAEADHVPAGFLAWRDESPGVAYLADISVHPDYQRFGIGTALLEALRAEARAVGLGNSVVRCWEKATWAMAFYKAKGFEPIQDDAPAKVLGWKVERSEGRPLTRPGEVLLWAPIGKAPIMNEETGDVEEEPTLVTGSIRGGS